MEEIAPGSILQRMYIKKRLPSKQSLTFCEIGCGSGYLSNILLKRGYKGEAYDLNAESCNNAAQRNIEYIKKKLYAVYNSDFLTDISDKKYDIIISSMVIEHLSNDDVEKYFSVCKKKINQGGRIIVLVPSCMKYWGIEDEIAGHYKRYERADFREIARKYKLKIVDMSGLTYPISNWLFSLSNSLVKKSEAHKMDLSKLEQTKLSGNRSVKYKTSFPFYFKLILNEMVLFPFYILQRLFKNHPRSMVLYCELSM